MYLCVSAPYIFLRQLPCHAPWWTLRNCWCWCWSTIPGCAATQKDKTPPNQNPMIFPQIAISQDCVGDTAYSRSRHRGVASPQPIEDMGDKNKMSLCRKSLTYNKLLQYLDMPLPSPKSKDAGALHSQCPLLRLVLHLLVAHGQNFNALCQSMCVLDKLRQLGRSQPYSKRRILAL